MCTHNYNKNHNSYIRLGIVSCLSLVLVKLKMSKCCQSDVTDKETRDEAAADAAAAESNLSVTFSSDTKMGLLQDKLFKCQIKQNIKTHNYLK